MPRTSADETELGHLLAGPRLLQPPADLDGPARQVFVEVVAAVAPGHFEPQDIHLIASYARVVALERRAASEIAAGHREWVEVQRSLIQSLALLARTLSLGTKARRPNQRSRKGAGPVSAYETLGLGSLKS